MASSIHIELPEVRATFEQLQAVLRELKSSNGQKKLSAQTELYITNNPDVSKKQLIMELEKYLNQANRVIVHTPEQLSVAFEQRLIDWFRTQIADNILLSFRVDTSLLAGIIVHTPNRLYDFSLRSGLQRGRAYIQKQVVQ